MNERIESLLHAEAESIETAPYIPISVRRRIRRRQGALVGLAVTGVLAVAAGSLAITNWETKPLPPVESGPQESNVIERGDDWRLVVRDDPNRVGDQERVCAIVRDDRTCLDGGGVFEDVSVSLGYVEVSDKVVVVVKAPSGTNSVGMREINGTSWAALWAGGRYFYRFFEGDEVHGILTVHGADAPQLEFSVEVKGPEVHTSVERAGDPFPELRGFPGEKQVLASGPEGGGYSVLMRTTEDEVCVHFGDDYRCRSADAPVGPIRLWIAKLIPCSREDECGRGNHLAIISGEIGPDVAKLGFGSPDEGFSWLYITDGGFGCCTFSTSDLYARDGDVMDFVAFDSDDNPLETVRVRLTLDTAQGGT